ncbi:hypothetical protein C0585_04320 [Candidatus Woesearchaeota archaeon]|nr:MAG: hypothetical protein C0585_04320 [Candidatus Woesearchaeota archaeon]
METIKHKGKIHIHPGFETFILASISIIIFLSIELISRIRDWYRIFPYIDIFTHLLAGISLFFVAFWIGTVLKDKHKHKLAFFFVVASSIIWEIMETLEEMIVPNPPHLKDIFFWDGFFDIIFAIIGGFIAFSFILNYMKTFRKLIWKS